jgi:hypothetical protein
VQFRNTLRRAEKPAAICMPLVEPLEALQV